LCWRFTRASYLAVLAWAVLPAARQRATLVGDVRFAYPYPLNFFNSLFVLAQDDPAVMLAASCFRNSSAKSGFERTTITTHAPLFFGLLIFVL